MGKTYLGTTINSSPTVVFPAGADISGARCVALALSNGKLALPAAGAMALGISIGETDENVAAGTGFSRTSSRARAARTPSSSKV